MCSQPSQPLLWAGTATLSAGHTDQQLPISAGPGLAASLQPQRMKKCSSSSVPTGTTLGKASRSPKLSPSPAVLFLTFRLSLRTVKRIKEAGVSFKEHQKENMISAEGRFHALPASSDISWWERDEANESAHPWATADVNSTLLQHLDHLSSVSWTTLFTPALSWS